jgi:asparagine synthase (glutamine-hydrolysing)
MPASDYVMDVLSPGAIKGAGYFDAKAVTKLNNKCRAQTSVGFRDNAAFVGVLSTQLWHFEFAAASNAIVPSNVTLASVNH